MADERQTVRADEEILGRKEDIFRTNDFAFRRKNGSRVSANILYRVMRVSVRNGPTRQAYFAAVVSVEETPTRLSASMHSASA